MSVATAEPRTAREPDPGVFGWGLSALATALQFAAGLFTFVFAARMMDPFTRQSRAGIDERPEPAARLLHTLAFCWGLWGANAILLCLLVCLTVPGGLLALTGLTLWTLSAQRRKPQTYHPAFAVYGRVVQGKAAIWSGVFRLLGTVVVCGLSLLPLSSLLVAFPAVNPQETVLTESVPAKSSWVRRLLRRVLALTTGLTVFMVLLAVSVEVVSRLPLPEKGSFAVIARSFLPAPASFMGRTPAEQDKALETMSDGARAILKTPLADRLPPAMVEHWPFVILGVYLGDLLVLLAVGKVPLAYNLRNVRVRWKTNAMTAFAFASVIGLLTFLLAFVNGMNNLTANTGAPGNVFVLSDGSTDEMFSNLGYGDVDNVERVVVKLDERNRPLAEPVRVRRVDTGTPSGVEYPVPDSDPPQVRAVSFRRFGDPVEFAKMYGVRLAAGEWFGADGRDDQGRVECVLGEAVAATLGAVVGREQFAVGDSFRLGDTKYVVTGLTQSASPEYRSEVWTKGVGRAKFLASRETYYAINQPVPLKAGEWEKHLETHPRDADKRPEPLRRRFVQVRSLEEPEVAGAVHNVELVPGGRWFSKTGVDGDSRIECVLGEGVAGVLGEDLGKTRLEPGDEFTLGDERTMRWVVTGVMKSEGTTFGSEVWVKRFNRITKPFGKENYTTLVLRTEQDTIDASRAMAHHLSTRYTQQKLKAFAEPEYYAELTKTNNFFLTAVVIVAVVMAIGGVFGMMTTMFASIAQRIRDIGVLRLLGFKRWQVTVSFLLESLTIATLGGAVGCFLAWFFADGKSSVSTLSGGGGGPGGKSFALTIDVDSQVMALGMTFTLVMGRLGGLVPALSAMRMKILDSLR